MQKVTDDKIINTQIYEVLIRLDEDVKNKIPNEIIELYKSSKDDEYEFFYDENKSFDEQELSRKAIVAIAALYIKYCCPEESQKEFLHMFKENGKNQKNELEERYDLEKMLKYKNQKVSENKVEENTELRQYEKKSFVKKIMDRIKHLFKSK